MDLADFDYPLPASLIAQHPAEPRSASRLLTLDGASGALGDRLFGELPDLLEPGDLLVGNDTRVMPARLLGRKATGGTVEVLIERLLDDGRALAQLKVSKPPRPGTRLLLEPQGRVEVAGRAGEFYLIDSLEPATFSELMACAGHVPLPPYIARGDQAFDRERYQTVYARRDGAVAAPTAGLHFDPALLDRLRQRGIDFICITLHVGAGTFQPVRAARVEEHRMHREAVAVPAAICERIAATRAAGGRVIAVGTTVVRALETAAAAGGLVPFEGETDIFIYPGFRFRVADHLITNFHLPRSSLLLLVCAFAGRERVLSAYRHAVDREYRFYSYGDAMLIKAAPDSLSRA